MSFCMSSLSSFISCTCAWNLSCLCISFNFNSCLVIEEMSDFITATCLKKSSRKLPFAAFSLNWPDSMSEESEDFVLVCETALLSPPYTRSKREPLLSGKNIWANYVCVCVCVCFYTYLDRGKQIVHFPFSFVF